MNHWTKPARPYSIAHRGASAYAPDCSLEAYEKAARLGADFWEVDIRLSADGDLIVFHDAAFGDGTRLSDLTAQEITARAVAENVSAVPFALIIERAKTLDAGIYADIKDTAATLPVLNALLGYGFERAILGAFDPDAAQMLADANCPYPRSALVPLGADPFEHAAGADIIHLCWERMERPQDLLDDAFFAEANRRNQAVVLWHEEDPARMAALRGLPVLGICSDRPELVHPFSATLDWPVQIVCHRGACEFAPENTLAATHCAFAAGFDVVELDLHKTLDGAQIVIHDPSLERTTSGQGGVSWHTEAQIASLDAGSWFSPHFATERVPTFAQLLEVGAAYAGEFYVELKSADPAAVLKIVQDAGMLSQCFFWSFEAQKLDAIRALSPEARLMVRRQDIDTLDAAFARWTPDVIEYVLNEDLSEFAECRLNNVRPMIAYMGKNHGMFERIIEARPDMVNLHFPFIFRDLLGEIGLGRP